MRQKHSAKAGSTRRARQIREAIARWRVFNVIHQSRLDGLTYRELIEDGRRF